MAKKAGIAELKSRYKLLVANRETIPSHDMGSDIPVSSGSPAVDSFLLEKIRPTLFMPEYEHLMRSWQLIQKMSDAEEKVILDNLQGCLNDHKALLAARYFSENDTGGSNKVLRSMPFSWRLLFPLVLIKPAMVFFDGWKTDLRFRLTENFSFEKLRELYAETLEEAGDTAILKFREKIHATTALLGYRFETKKEKAIENWCFHDGRKARELPTIGLYVRAREKLNKNGPQAFLKELYSSSLRLPITSVMGLLSSKDLVLYVQGNEKLQDYAVECSSPIESLLRLREWSPWLKETHMAQIAQKIKRVSAATQIPFAKITQAYLVVPEGVREKMTDTVYIPLLKKFGESVKFLLPKRFSLLQPANFIQLENFLMFNVFNAVSTGEMILVGEKDDYHFSFSVDDVKNVVNMDRNRAEEFLLEKFGGLTSIYYYTYSPDRLLQAMSKIDAGELLLFNTPFFSSIEVVEKLMRWAKVINLSTYFGAPTEISIKYNYENFLKVKNIVSVYKLRQNPAVYRAVDYLEKLYWFEKTGGELGG